MPQSIDVGAVLGGRYKVIRTVLTSADGDIVLDGMDQVLDRPVSILVASTENASQVATSAREIATGERFGAMQVLDLGISDGSTYLITNVANPADLLDLVIQSDAPYIEPFYTDTLGSEIFGVSRSSEPEVHEDDDEYYEELRAQEESRPAAFDRLPEINLSDKLSGLKARFGKGREGANGAPAGAGAAGVAGAGAAAGAAAARGAADVRDAETPDRARQEEAGRVEGRQVQGQLNGVRQDEAQTGPLESTRPDATQAIPAPPSAPPQAHAPQPAPQQSAGTSDSRSETGQNQRQPKVTLWTDDEVATGPTETAPAAGSGQAGVAAAGAAAAGTGSAAAGAGTGAAAMGAGTGAAGVANGRPMASGAAASSGGGRPASKFPALARDYENRDDQPVYADAEYEDEEPEEGNKKATRLIVGAVLGVLLILGVVFAFNNLAPQNAPVAGNGASSSPAASEGADAPGEESPESPAAPVVEPQVAGIERLVPGNQELNAETDDTLARAIDGNSGTIYRSYSFTQPKFGGFASNMVLVVELEELSDVSAVELSGLNGTGGEFEVRIGESDDLGSSQEISSGSFTGPTVSVPVSGDGQTGVKGKYVFINVTELPRLASGGNSSRPYGLQVAEIKVS